MGPLTLSTAAVIICAALSGYVVVDTGQTRCYGNDGAIPCPEEGQPFYGQDAQYEVKTPAYRDNEDGSILDLNTGLIWQRTPDFAPRTWEEAVAYAGSLTQAGYADWRVPTMKELFSIADFRGNRRASTPFIDTAHFDFRYPSAEAWMREMDAHYWSADRYAGRTMFGDRSAFGFNFADGRAAACPIQVGERRQSGMRRYVRCVRGPAYGRNDFHDNGDGTITDKATGLMWAKADSGRAMPWEEALAYAEKFELAGRHDWRLPNVKELQSIADYTRAPDAVSELDRGAAINPVFDLTREESWFWSSTTHAETGFAYYVAFGQAFSTSRRRGQPVNAHGAGAVRSDPKHGDPADWPEGLGPQSDELRILNYARCVRGGNVRKVTPDAP